MAQIDLGKLKFNWKGAWATATAYEVDDVVSYGGASFVVTVAVPSNNSTHPKANSSFSYMSTGFEMKGAWTSGVTYYRGEIVSYNNAFYVVIVDNNDSVKSNSPVAQSSGSSATMALFNNAPSADVLTTSGDLLVRDNDGVTNKRLGIGVIGSRLTAVDTPNEDIANQGNYVYQPVNLSASSRSHFLVGDDNPAYANPTYVVTVAAVSGQDQFHMSGTGITGTVERPTIVAKVGHVITFDVSDATNTGHVLAFAWWTGSSYPDIYDETGAGIVRSGTPGQAGASITWTVNPIGLRIFKYNCSVHSGMSNGTITNGYGVPSTPALYRDPYNAGAVKIAKGKSYTFTFPADGLTYSIKDPSASGYSGAGSGGRITDGTVQPQSVTNGGSITYTPAANSSLANVVIRNEANQNDVQTLTLTDPAREPAWTEGGNSQLAGTYNLETRPDKRPHQSLWPNDDVNIYTESIWPLPAYLKKSGRGFRYGTFSASGYRQFGLLSKNGDYLQGGNMYANGTQGQYYGGGLGANNTWNATFNYPLRANHRLDLYWRKALAGDPDYAKFLTDMNGNDLGYLDADGNPTVTKPKVLQVHGGSAKKYYLYENGMVGFSGYGADGGKGDGTTDTRYAVVPVTFYDNSSTLLTGAAMPKIKQMQICDAHTGDTNTQDFNGMYYFLSTEGKLYRMGYNNYGVLGDGTTSNNYFNREMPMSLFGGEKIIYMTGSGYYYNSFFAITETGKLWGWGRNADGQLGIGNTTQQNAPIEITAVSGSLLENKKVVHVFSSQGDDDIGKTWFLTDEGKVYFAGTRQSYGIYCGAYHTSSANATSPVELTNASTLWNSDNQKVIYMVMSQAERHTIYFITDGGTTGHSQKVYATGSNSYGRYGAGVTTTHGATASSQGNWFGAEIKFRDMGDYHQSTGNSDRPNETTGMTLDSLQTGANKNKFKVGRITEILPWAYHNEDYGRVVLIDEYGSLFIAGHWSYSPSDDMEDDSQDTFNNANEYVTSFVPVFQQPEPVAQGGWCHLASQTYTENAWQIIGKSGQYYVGGYNGYEQTGNKGSSHGFFIPQWAIGGSN